jgi:tetratricopeptide (TPR) repeat protein
MRSPRAVKHFICLWVAYCAIPSAVQVASLPNAAARKREYQQRERDKYECRPAQEAGTADIEKARRLWESGMIYYDAGELQKARTNFQSAYDISRLPDFLINLAKVSAKLELYIDATKFLEAYVQECPGAPDAPMARQRIEELRIAQALKEGTKPPPAPTRLPPKLAIALMVGGGVALIVGIGLGGATLAAAKQVGNAANHNRVFDPSLQAAERRGQAMAAPGLMLDVLGGVALVSGGAWSLAWLYEQKTGLTLTAGSARSGLAGSGGF